MAAEYTTHTLYDGQVRIRFYPNSHQYKLEGEKSTLLSPSSVKSLFEDGSLLTTWALGMTRKHLDAYAEKNGYPVNEAEFRLLIDDACRASERYTQKTADWGTQIHAFCDAFAKAKIAGEQFDIDAAIEGKDQEVLNGILGFVNWYHERNVVFVNAERVLYSKKMNLVGTTDLIAYVDGILSIVDYKTGSLRATNIFTTACYRSMWNEEMRKKAHQIVVLNLSRDGDFRKPVVIGKADLDEMQQLIKAAVRLKYKTKAFARKYEPIIKAA